MNIENIICSISSTIFYELSFTLNWIYFIRFNIHMYVHNDVNNFYVVMEGYALKFNGFISNKYL
jgi:hypothetical protein